MRGLVGALLVGLLPGQGTPAAFTTYEALAATLTSAGPTAHVAPRTPVPGDGPDPCGFSTVPQVLIDEEGRLLQYWIEKDRPALFQQTLPPSPALHAFRERISLALDPDSRALLEAQLAHVEGGDLENVRAVLEGRAGAIRSMRCLEGLLFSVQAERTVRLGSSMFETPTEFLSYVLAREGDLKIYFYTVDQPGIGGLSTVHQPLQADLEAGWRVVGNIHNHNFFPASDRVLGGVVPSAADVQALRSARDSFGLPTASIVNGFHALEITGADLDAFSGG
jgi:hypothetical protein